jgi:hypothetical protein
MSEGEDDLYRAVVDSKSGFKRGKSSMYCERVLPVILALPIECNWCYAVRPRISKTLDCTTSILLRILR